VPRFDPPGGLGDDQYWVAGAVFDGDHDGRLDVFLGEWEPALASPWFRGEGDVGHWLEVEVGSAGSAGVGAVVEVAPRGAGGGVGAVATIVASTGYGSGAVPRARFGLGDVDEVDVAVVLPDGTRVERSGVATDQVLRIPAP